MIKLSVIIPIYNTPHNLLEHCLTSVKGIISFKIRSLRKLNYLYFSEALRPFFINSTYLRYDGTGHRPDNQPIERRRIWVCSYAAIHFDCKYTKSNLSTRKL